MDSTLVVCLRFVRSCVPSFGFFSVSPFSSKYYFVCIFSRSLSPSFPLLRGGKEEQQRYTDRQIDRQSVRREEGGRKRSVGFNTLCTALRFSPDSFLFCFRRFGTSFASRWRFFKGPSQFSV